MSYTAKITTTFKRILPRPFTIAILLTFLTFIIALIVTRPVNTPIIKHTLTLLAHWETGLWNDTRGGLYFAFQMMFMLVLGHVLALSVPISRIITSLTKFCITTSSAAAIVTLSTIIVSLFNWGLGLIFGAILARKIGEKFSINNKPLNYGLIGASAYSGLMVWHGGISGSAPIKATETNNLRNLVQNNSGLNLDLLPTSIPFDNTIFSSMNITVSILLIILLPTMMYLLGKNKFTPLTLPQAKIGINKKSITPVDAQRLDSSRLFSALIGLLFISYAFYKAVILPDTLSLKFINPNFINFTLLGLAFMMHRNIHQLLTSANQAIIGALGILIQFPLYFGILGIMAGSGLIVDISNTFVSHSNENTFPILTFFSAGLINIFVPSGGAQWSLQGPIIISAAQELGVSYSKSIMALAYGDQLTNMLQPFWALPLLGITGLKAKDILGYTVLLFFAGGSIFLIGLTIF